MPTTKKNTTVGSTEGDLSTTTIFELLADERRQLALQYLTRAVGGVHLDDLADQVALWEGERTRDRDGRIAISLVHVHLPKLVEAGVVRYDREDERVSLCEPADRLSPYLELATTPTVQ